MSFVDRHEVEQREIGIDGASDIAHRFGKRRRLAVRRDENRRRRHWRLVERHVRRVRDRSAERVTDVVDDPDDGAPGKRVRRAKAKTAADRRLPGPEALGLSPVDDHHRRRAAPVADREAAALEQRHPNRLEIPRRDREEEPGGNTLRNIDHAFGANADVLTAESGDESITSGSRAPRARQRGQPVDEPGDRAAVCSAVLVPSNSMRA